MRRRIEKTKTEQDVPVCKARAEKLAFLSSFFAGVNLDFFYRALSFRTYVCMKSSAFFVRICGELQVALQIMGHFFTLVVVP